MEGDNHFFLLHRETTLTPRRADSVGEGGATGRERCRRCCTPPRRSGPGGGSSSSSPAPRGTGRRRRRRRRRRRTRPRRASGGGGAAAEAGEGRLGDGRGRGQIACSKFQGEGDVKLKRRAHDINFLIFPGYCVKNIEPRR